MVLPASAADVASGQAGARWIERIAKLLRLGRPGVLILVDRAAGAQMGAVVRALWSEHPKIEIHTEASQVVAMPPGSVAILVVRPADAAYLNLHRPVFAERSLKVILWSEAFTSGDLARLAPDFFDWISHRIECPPAVPRHAVMGLRSALCARAPGIVWYGDQLEEIFRIALPRRSLQRVSPTLPYTKLVELIRRAGANWLYWPDIHDSTRQHLRIRWALAEAGRRTRVLLVDPSSPSPGWWRIVSSLCDIADARRRLAAVGAKTPGRLAALAELEPEAIQLLEELFRKRVDEDAIERAMLTAADPGAALARMGVDEIPIALETTIFGAAPLPILRAIAVDPRIRRARDLRLSKESIRFGVGWTPPDSPAVGDELEVAAGQWAAYARAGSKHIHELLSHPFRAYARYAIEVTLRSRPKTSVTWEALRRAARTVGDLEVSLAFAKHIGNQPPTERTSLPRYQRSTAPAIRLESRGDPWEDLEGAIDGEYLLQHEDLDLTSAVQTLLDQGKSAEAEAAARSVLAVLPLFEAWMEEEYSDAPVLRLLGVCLLRQGKYKEAARHLREASKSESRLLSPYHPDRARTLSHVAAVLSAQGQTAEAEKAAMAALSIWRRTASLSKNHRSKIQPLRKMFIAETAELLRQLASIQTALHRPEAPRTAEQALHALHEAFGPDHPITREATPVLQRIMGMAAAR